MNTLGSTTKTILQKGFPGDLLHEQFVADVAIKEGQFVTLTSNGKITPITTSSMNDEVIGIAEFDAGAGTPCTVAMKGYGTLMCEGSASTNPGPVKFASFQSGTGFNRVAAIAAPLAAFVASASAGSPTTAATLKDPKMIGWQLDASTSAGDVVRVVVKN
jgi:hypothetical protein